MKRFGSVCSGIEAASVAWHPLGWRAAWLAEIEPFPCAVLAHHYPEVPNLGDMTTITGRVLAREVEAPDVFTGGTPCQAFSVAGKRESLGDARGNLSLTFCEIANAIDDVRRADGREPSIVVWENVPGVLSTADNAFGCFLGALAGADCELQPAGKRWTDAGVVLGPRRTVAWRVLDAQYFGLAQRRRRVFVVASARDGFDPCAVLFELDGLRRDSAPRREAWEGTSEASGNGAAFGGGAGTFAGPISMAHGQGGAEIGFDRGPTLTCNHEAPIVAHTLRGEGFDASEDGTGRGTPLVPVSVALRGRDGGAACEVGDDCAFTLRASSGGGDKPHVLAPVAFDTTQITSAANYSNPKPGDPCHPLSATAHPPAISFHANAQACQLPGPDTDTSASLTCSQHAAVAYGLATSVTPKFARELSPTLTIPSPTGGGQPAAMAQGMSVRRLTPRECERLQGFPDDYALIPWRKKPAEDCPDGPRYKALGNSWAVPCAAWIGARIDAQLGAASQALEAAA